MITFLEFIHNLNYLNFAHFTESSSCKIYNSGTWQLGNITQNVPSSILKTCCCRFQMTSNPKQIQWLRWYRHWEPELYIHHYSLFCSNTNAKQYTGAFMGILLAVYSGILGMFVIELRNTPSCEHECRT